MFHLLVPGGGWHTVIVRPVVAASSASSVFHCPGAVPVGAASVRADQQPGSVRVQCRSGVAAFAVNTHRDLSGVPTGDRRAIRTP
jgi:hypothetical protein